MSMAEGGPSAPSSNNSSDFFVADSSEESLETVSSGQIKKKGSLAVLPHTKRLEVVKDMHLKKRVCHLFFLLFLIHPLESLEVPQCSDAAIQFVIYF